MIEKIIEFIKMPFKRHAGIEVEAPCFQTRTESLKFSALMERIADPEVAERTRFRWDGYDICRVVPVDGAYELYAWMGDLRGEKKLEGVITGWHVVRVETALVVAPVAAQVAA